MPCLEQYFAASVSRNARWALLWNFHVSLDDELHVCLLLLFVLYDLVLIMGIVVFLCFFQVDGMAP